jgi:Zn-finger domain-containing protein
MDVSNPRKIDGRSQGPRSSTPLRRLDSTPITINTLKESLEVTNVQTTLDSTPITINTLKESLEVTNVQTTLEKQLILRNKP